MKRAGELLSSFFDQNVYAEARKYSDLFSSWKGIAGDTLACHSRIRELDKTILLVEADHPGWIQILQTKQAELLDRVRRRFPDLSISGISFCLSKSDQQLPSRCTLPEKQKSETVQENDTSIESSYDAIHDESFKELLKRLEKSIESRKS